MKCNLVLIMVFLVMGAEAQTISRKAVFLKGQEFNRLYTGTVDVVIKIGTMEQKTLNSATRSTDIIIKEVLDTAYLVHSTLTRVTQKRQGSGKNDSFDSDDSTSSSKADWARDLKKKVGVLNHLVVNRKGYIVSSEDTTDVKTATTGLPGTLNNQADHVGDSYELVASLPARAVKQGESWVDSSVSKDDRQIIKYTLTSLGADEAIIDIIGTVASKLEIGEGKFKTVIKLAGGGTARVICDPATGIIRKMEHDYQTSGTISMQDSEFPITIRSAHSVVITAKKP